MKRSNAEQICCNLPGHCAKRILPSRHPWQEREDSHAAGTSVSNYAPLGWLYYKWVGFPPLVLFQSQNPPSPWFTDEDKGGVKVASFTGRTAPGPLSSHTAIAAAETCSWPSITITKNTGLWDLRYSHYLRRSETEGETLLSSLAEAPSHWAQSVLGHRQEGLKEGFRAPSMNSASAIATGALFALSCRSQTQQTFTITKEAITDTPLKYCNDRITPDLWHSLNTCSWLYLLPA